MSTKYYCDKCGAEITSVPENKLTLKEGHFTKLDKDLCNGCKERLLYWFNCGEITFYHYAGGGNLVVNPNQSPYTIDNHNTINCIGSPSVTCNGKPTFTTP